MQDGGRGGGPGGVAVGLLGPLLLRVPHEVVLPAAKERAVVAALALRPQLPVPLRELAAHVWGDRPPASADKTLQNYVRRLRNVLPPGLLVTLPGGYRLVVPPGAVDAECFEQLAAEGRAALERGEDDRAVEACRAATALWRGDALPDLPESPAARAAAVRWEELLRTAEEDLAEARLRRGEHVALVPLLEQAVGDAPLRERRWGLLMLALYRSGRQADALAAYGRAARRLGDELGLDVGPELARLQQAVLAHDPALDVRRAGPPAAPRRTAGALVGRTVELGRLGALLDGHRLVTVTGPGGVGKTRLALEHATLAAASGADVVVVDLSALRESGSVLPSVATALLVREEPGRGLLETVLGALRSRPVLLVLDDADHVLDPVARLLATLLPAAPLLRVLVTSREPLGLEDEARLVLGPLAVPRPGAGVAELRGTDAVRLFTARALAAAPSFAVTEDNADAVGDLCRRLDGLPLALELAAARTDVLGPAQLVARIATGAPVLEHPVAPPGVAGRHAGLRAVLDWSRDLLDEPERLVLDRLSVFPSSFPLEAAEVVCAGGPVQSGAVLRLLAGLVRRSLVEVVPAGPERRYRLLATVRADAQERLALAAGTGAAVDRLVDWVDRHTTGVAPTLSLRGQTAVMDGLEAEVDTLRVALQRCLDTGRSAVGLRIAVAVFPFWYARSRRAEGRDWLVRLTSAAGDATPLARVEALHAAAVLVVLRDARAVSGLAATAHRLAGKDPTARAVADAIECWAGLGAGDAVPARAAYDRAAPVLRRPDPVGETQPGSWLRWAEVWLAVLEGDLAAAVAHGTALTALLAHVGDVHLLGGWLCGEADVLAASGRPADAAAAATRSWELALQVGCPSCQSQATTSLVLLGRGELLGGDEAALSRAVHWADTAGETMGLADALEVLASVRVRAGRVAEAAVVLGAAQGLRERTGLRLAYPARTTAAAAARDVVDRDPRLAEVVARGRGLAYADVLRLVGPPG